MIELKLDDYCQDCPRFEPKKVDLSFSSKVVRTMVVCEYSHFCHNIRKHLEEKMKYEKGENSNERNTD